MNLQISPILDSFIGFDMDKTIYPPNVIVNLLSSLTERLSICFWFDGRFLPKPGSKFMKTHFFEPIFQIPNAKIYLYSLQSWSFQKTISKMPLPTSLGDRINSINTAFVECIYSSSFFKYCAVNNPLSDFINTEITQNEWLRSLSQERTPKRKTIAKFFETNNSLFQNINNLDVNHAYSILQYFEGYYLIQKIIREELSKGNKNITTAFVLPNDKSKYYKGCKKNIYKMLHLDFGTSLHDVQIRIIFRFFEYRNIEDRPYISKEKNVYKMTPDDMDHYFHYLPRTLDSQ